MVSASPAAASAAGDFVGRAVLHGADRRKQPAQWKQDRLERVSRVDNDVALADGDGRHLRGQDIEQPVRQQVEDGVGAAQFAVEVQGQVRRGGGRGGRLRRPGRLDLGGKNDDSAGLATRALPRPDHPFQPLDPAVGADKALLVHGDGLAGQGATMDGYPRLRDFREHRVVALPDQVARQAIVGLPALARGQVPHAGVEHRNGGWAASHEIP
jgi:hypothetical protein